MPKVSKKEAIKQVPRRELYPTGEAQILLCCAPSFLKNEMDEGRLGYIIRGSRRLIPAFAIDEYLRAQTQKSMRGVET